jgi:hypothetical protein
MNQKGNVLVIILAIVASLALAGGAYFYGQNQTLKKITETPTGVDVTSAPLSQSPASSANPTATPAKTATVVFEAEGSFTASEKDELKKKVINPFLDYYTTESDQVLLTLTISKNNQASKDTYPYQAQAIFQGGGNMGFLIMKLGTGVDWWYPECMNGCNLSASYKAKYPEIASKVQ